MDKERGFMDKYKWKKKIKDSCIAIGTYQEHFNTAIESLSQILEDRDNARDKWEKEGCIYVIEHTNKGGATNPTKNPLLTLIIDLNSQALTYMKELCLTPASLNKIKQEEEKKETTIEDVLSGLIDGK